ncbi:MAG TPA: hypothetical protein VL981_11180 [Candidatus Methylacidiphilales bacterium]|nr:hypothetical protein [Candidatus Methylacidiphilales bacterium]
MQFDQKQLFQIARDYPWWLFTGEEIAALCNVCRDQVTRVRSAHDSPFRFNKCRPEWFTEWMRTHPEFQQTKSADQTSPAESCAEVVKTHLRNKTARRNKRSSRQLLAAVA